MTGHDQERKFLKAEILVSRGFMFSAQEMFGNSYKAIIRNLVDRHGKELTEYYQRDMDFEGFSDAEKIQHLMENAVSADKIEVFTEDDGDIVTLRVYDCGHFIGRHIRGEMGLEEPRVCPVTILLICFIREVMGRRVVGGKKRPEYRDEKGYCEIRLELQ